MFGHNDRLISGVEPHPFDPEEPIYGSDDVRVDASQIEHEQWRVFVGPRWAWKYVLVDFKQAQAVYHAWQGTQHLYAPISEKAEIYLVPVEERLDSAEDEKAMFYRVEELMKREVS